MRHQPVPNAYTAEHDTYRIAVWSDAVENIEENTEILPVPTPNLAPIRPRYKIVRRRWVYMPGEGEGAVFCDEDGTTYGALCFAGRRTTRAPERIEEPEGGW